MSKRSKRLEWALDYGPSITASVDAVLAVTIGVMGYVGFIIHDAHQLGPAAVFLLVGAGYGWLAFRAFPTRSYYCVTIHRTPVVRHIESTRWRGDVS